jgi:hypothetical protein
VKLMLAAGADIGAHDLSSPARTSRSHAARELLPKLRQAFIDYSADPSTRARRVRGPLPGPGTATVLFPGVTPGIPPTASEDKF